MKTSILNACIGELWEMADPQSLGYERAQFMREARKLIRQAIRDDLIWQDRDSFKDVV